MNSSDLNKSGGQALSLPAMLAMLLGVGGLFFLWKFDFLFEDVPETWRALILGVSIALVLWGTIRSFSELPIRATRRRFGFGRHRVSLPRPGQFYLVIMVVVFSGSLLGRSNMLMLVFSLMAGPFVVNGWITYSMLQRTAVERVAATRVMAGEPLTVELVLINRKRLMNCWLMSAHDTIQNDDESLNPSVLFARVPAGGRRSGHYHARLMRRGRYRFGPVQLTARFPLGIVERGLVFQLPGEILVYPRLGRLSARWMREHFLATDLVERRELRQGAFDDEFHRIREFRWGDNPRAIHWRTSARHNALMVREYHQSRDLNLMVLADLWLPPRPTSLERERLELAMSVTATMCVSHMKQSRDSTLHVAVAGRQLVQWDGESRMANAGPLMDHFASAEGSPSPQVTAMLQHAASKRLHGVRTLLITTRADGSAGRQELAQFVAQAAAADMLGNVEIVEADYAGLNSIFEFV
jgi:uncharacterized protein (DUF58 family)